MNQAEKQGKPGTQSPKRALEDHTRIGKRFVPRLLQMRNVEVSSYAKDLLPDTIWIALLVNRFGPQRGIEISLEVANAAHRIVSREKFHNFSLARSYEEVTLNEAEAIRSYLTNQGVLLAIQEGLAPLLELYEGFPMAFLESSGQEYVREHLVGQLRDCVSLSLDKQSHLSLITQTVALYVRGTTGGLSVLKGTEIPDLNLIIDRPDSEEGKNAAAFVRAAVMMEYPRELGDASWARSFWDQSLGVDECDLGGVDG